MKVLSRCQPTAAFVSIHNIIKNYSTPHPLAHRLAFYQTAHELHAFPHTTRYTVVAAASPLTQSSSLLTALSCPPINRPLQQQQQRRHQPLGAPLVPFLQTIQTHFHTLRHVPAHPALIGKDDGICGLTRATLSASTLLHVRHKSKKKQYDSEEESDSDQDDNLDEDDFEAPSQFKVQAIHSPSLRIDAILSKALGLGRHRLEETFFGPGILLNGKKLLKKGGKMEEGDYVDAVVERQGEKLKVRRVKLLKVGSQRTSTEKLILKVRIWKSPFLLDNPDKWRPES